MNSLANLATAYCREALATDTVGIGRNVTKEGSASLVIEAEHVERTLAISYGFHASIFI